MTISRRDSLKLGVFAGAAVALPLERTVSAGPLQSRLADSRLPVPFTTSFVVPRVLAKDRTDATTDYYTVTMRPTTVQIAPGFETTMWGYNGMVPGPTIVAEYDRRSVVRFINRLPATHPDLGYTPWTRMVA